MISELIFNLNLLDIHAGQVHDTRSAAATGFDEVTRGKHNSAHCAEHWLRLGMIDRRFHNDASAAWQIRLPGTVNERDDIVELLSEL